MDTSITEIDVEALSALVRRACAKAGMAPSEMIMSIAVLLAVENYRHSKDGHEDEALEQAIQLCRHIHAECMSDAADAAVKH